MDSARRSPPAQLWIEFALLALLALLWGSSYLFIRIAVEDIPPATLIAIRVTIAAIVLGALARVLGYHGPRGADVWARLSLQAFFNSFGAWTLLAWGQQYVDSGLAGVLNSTAPIFVLSATIVMGAAKGPLLRRLIGVLVGLAGVVIIMGPSALAGLGGEVLAQVAILAGAGLYACAAIHGRRFSSQPAIVTAAATMAVASLVLIPVSIVLDRPWALRPNLEALVAAGTLGLFCTALALVIYFRLIRTLGPLGTASQAYLRSGVALLLGILILGERVDTLVMLGAILAIGGVILINLPPRRRE